MTDMALSPDEAKKENSCLMGDDSDDGPKYPYGLSLSLDAVTLKKLGITQLPKVGETMHLMAVAEVSTTSQYENQSGSEMCVNLQITQLDLGGEGPGPAASLYGDA
ncbi:hypothetical protein CAL26_09950 [Bordetella genomosp. 9]|uniref:Uncharacterized protein n=2 Tax=Bordetella genomosp. 9 TaxID=1416803 RepID=A0A261RHF1_9BORD|nr:hypothetical protein CAL26_09950 [Bordetella genomosp. 9]